MVPLQEAAKQLSSGLSVLKRTCRSKGLARWPYRSRQSLRGLIKKSEACLVGLSACHSVVWGQSLDVGLDALVPIGHAEVRICQVAIYARRMKPHETNSGSPPPSLACQGVVHRCSPACLPWQFPDLQVARSP